MLYLLTSKESCKAGEVVDNILWFVNLIVIYDRHYYDDNNILSRWKSIMSWQTSSPAVHPKLYRAEAMFQTLETLNSQARDDDSIFQSRYNLKRCKQGTRREAVK